MTYREKFRKNGILLQLMAAQMIAAGGRELYYHTLDKEGSTHYYEVDYLISDKSRMTAFEVKSSGTGKHASAGKYSANIDTSYLLSLKDADSKGTLFFVPRN